MEIAKAFDESMRKGFVEFASEFASILEPVLKEVSNQKRIRMDNWTTGKRTVEESATFKQSLVDYYQRQGVVDSSRIRCMILDIELPGSAVRGAHIWKSFTNGEGLEDFCLKRCDVSTARNGFLLANRIEEYFDRKFLCFLYDPLGDRGIFLKVLHPEKLAEEVAPGHSNLTFADIDGRPLLFPVVREDEPFRGPFRRILSFHARRSYLNAQYNAWLPFGVSYASYFQLSENASINFLKTINTLV